MCLPAHMLSFASELLVVVSPDSFYGTGIDRERDRERAKDIQNVGAAQETTFPCCFYMFLLLYATQHPITSLLKHHEHLNMHSTFTLRHGMIP